MFCIVFCKEKARKELNHSKIAVELQSDKGREIIRVTCFLSPLCCQSIYIYQNYKSLSQQIRKQKKHSNQSIMVGSEMMRQGLLLIIQPVLSVLLPSLPLCPAVEPSLLNQPKEPQSECKQTTLEHVIFVNLPNCDSLNLSTSFLDTPDLSPYFWTFFLTQIS